MKQDTVLYKESQAEAYTHISTKMAEWKTVMSSCHVITSLYETQTHAKPQVLFFSSSQTLPPAPHIVMKEVLDLF